MKPIIDVRNLEFSYGEKPVLNNINLSIDEGTFVSIIGPNGSGKTTLLKNMSGVLNPVSGNISFKGKEIRKYKKRELARHLAFVSQNTQVDFNFTVMDIVLMGRAPYMGPFESETVKDMEIAEKVMSMTNIYELKNKKITEISGGERQRVIIACALAQTPEVILLDEPVSNLDIQHQVDVLGILKKLNRENNMTVVTVLHDLNLAAEFSDIIMLLKEGKMLYSGTPFEVITVSNIENAYKTSVFMTKNPVSGNPHIIPIFKV